MKTGQAQFHTPLVDSKLVPVQVRASARPDVQAGALGVYRDLESTTTVDEIERDIKRLKRQ